MRLIWIMSLWVGSASAFASATEHEYRIYSFRWPSHERCHAHAKAIADRIAERHQVTVIGSGCERSEATQDTTAVVRYESAQPLQLVTTFPLGRYYHKRGVYRTESECQERLDHDIKIYQFHTQLDPIHAFCTSRRSSNEQPWFSYIDGFGSAVRRPDLLGWSDDRVYSHTKSELFDIIGRRLEPMGIWLTHLVWHPSAALGSVSAFVYSAADSLNFSAQTTVVATVTGIQECRAASESLDVQLSASQGGFQPLASYCTSPYSNPTSFSLIALHPSHWVQIVPSVDEFRTQSECELALPAVTEEMRGVRPKIAATVCGLRAHSLPARDNPYRVFAVAPN